MVYLKVVGGWMEGEWGGGGFVGPQQGCSRIWCAMVTRWGDDHTQKAGNAAPLQSERSQVNSSLISHQHLMNANAML